MTPSKNARKLVKLVGGPWDGDTVEFQSWQQSIVAPDPGRDYRWDGRYVLTEEGNAIWRVEHGSREET